MHCFCFCFQDKRLSKLHGASVGRQKELLSEKMQVFDHTNHNLRELLREWRESEVREVHDTKGQQHAMMLFWLLFPCFVVPTERITGVVRTEGCIEEETGRQWSREHCEFRLKVESSASLNSNYYEYFQHLPARCRWMKHVSLLMLSWLYGHIWADIWPSRSYLACLLHPCLNLPSFSLTATSGWTHLQWEGGLKAWRALRLWKGSNGVFVYLYFIRARWKKMDILSCTVQRPWSVCHCSTMWKQQRRCHEFWSRPATSWSLSWAEQKLKKDVWLLRFRSTNIEYNRTHTPELFTAGQHTLMLWKDL